MEIKYRPYSTTRLLRFRNPTMPAGLRKLQRKNRKGRVIVARSGFRDEATFCVNPYILTIKDGWNSRNMNAQENIDHVEWLAKSIAVEGVREPLKSIPKTENLSLSDGHSRLLATFKGNRRLWRRNRNHSDYELPAGQNETDRLMSPDYQKFRRSNCRHWKKGLVLQGACLWVG